MAKAPTSVRLPEEVHAYIDATRNGGAFNARLVALLRRGISGEAPLVEAVEKASRIAPVTPAAKVKSAPKPPKTGTCVHGNSLYCKKCAA